MIIGNKIPDWNKAPIWANWVCMDGDRITWNWFEFKPEYTSSKWMYISQKGKYQCCNEFVERCNVLIQEPWNSLQSRPA